MSVSVSLRAVAVLVALFAAGEAQTGQVPGVTLTEVSAAAPEAAGRDGAAAPATDASGNPAPSPYVLVGAPAARAALSFEHSSLGASRQV